MKRIYPLWLVIFASFFCYASMLTMFIPLLQSQPTHFYMSNYLINHTNILAGLFLAIYPLGQFLGSPIIGALSDKFGRKKILLISLLITLVCLLTIAYAIYIKSLALLALACLVAGLGESNMALALSAIADLTSDEERSPAFAKAFVFGSLGYIMGSLFGGVASIIGYSNPFIIEASLIFFIIFSVIIFFKDSNKHKTHKTIKQILLTFVSVFQQSELRQYYMANFISYIACFGVLRVQLIYMQDHLHLTQLQIGMFYSYASVIAMFSNFIVTPYLLKRMTLRQIILFAGTAAFASSVIFILPSTASALWVTNALLGMFIPMAVAMVGALISAKASTEQQGAVMGNNQSLQVLAEAIAALLGGLMYTISPIAPFIVFAFIGMIGITSFKREFSSNCVSQ